MLVMIRCWYRASKHQMSGLETARGARTGLGRLGLDDREYDGVPNERADRQKLDDLDWRAG
jgi:hypothetical protein